MHMQAQPLGKQAPMGRKREAGPYSLEDEIAADKQDFDDWGPEGRPQEHAAAALWGGAQPDQQDAGTQAS